MFPRTWPLSCSVVSLAANGRIRWGTIAVRPVAKAATLAVWRFGASAIMIAETLIDRHMVTISPRLGKISPSGTNENMPRAVPACVHMGR